MSTDKILTILFILICIVPSVCLMIEGYGLDKKMKKLREGVMK